MGARRSRLSRAVGRAMRMPAVLDRRGLRWLLKLLSPAPIVVLVHRGRRSGKIYRTPVEAITKDVEQGEIVVSPMWGDRSDWYRNLIAGGLVEVRVNGEGQRLHCRRLSEEETRAALASYRRNHPLYSRLIFRMLVWIHGLKGDPFEAVARALPMLALQRGTDPYER